MMEFQPRYEISQLGIIMGNMYEDDNFSSFVFHLRFPRRVTAMVIPVYKQITYDVGENGLVYSFDGIEGLHSFLSKKSLRYSQAKKNFLDKVLNRAFWPTRDDVLSVLKSGGVEI